MSVSSLTTLFLLIAFFVVMRQVWYLPYLKKAEERRLRELFESYCPDALMNSLARYAGTDKSFARLTPGVREALEDIFSKKGVRAGIELIQNERTEILLHVPYSTEFQDLCVTYRFGKLATIEITPPYRASTMLPE